jgi:hypothetical protein
MATVEELAEAYVKVLTIMQPAPPLTLMNHDAERWLGESGQVG